MTRGSTRPKSALRRATLQASLIVALVLAAGAVLLWLLLRNSLVTEVDNSLASRADSRVRLIEAGVDPTTLQTPLGDETFVWIGRSDGTTIATGGDSIVEPANVIAMTPTDVVVRRADVTFVEVDFDTEYGFGIDAEDDDDDDGEDDTETAAMRIVAANAVGPDGGAVTILTGSDLRRTNATLASARNLLLFAFPLAVVLVGLVTWIILGRAFDAVERIRQSAAEITGSRLNERVPVTGSGDEIDRLGSTMNDMLERLADHDQRQKRFTSDASHELKTPVANLRAIVETADPANEPWRQIRDRLVGESERMTALVDDLLFVSTRDEREPDEAWQPVHLDDLVFDEAAALKGRSDLRIDVSDVAPGSVDGRQSDLRRAIRNLADNAGRYATTTVRFAVVSQAGTVEVSVIDDGPGIALQDRETVFERFGRTDESRDRVGGGTGLGLSIVREIAAAHGGSVSIGDPQTAPEGHSGTTVTITLPIRGSIPRGVGPATPS